MTTNYQSLPLEELGKLVAERLGWRHAKFSMCWDHHHELRNSPAHPAEYLPLCAEFDLWPYVAGKIVTVPTCVDGDDPEVQHDNTPAGIQDAAHRALLIGILMKKDEE